MIKTKIVEPIHNTADFYYRPLFMTSENMPFCWSFYKKKHAINRCNKKLTRAYLQYFAFEDTATRKSSCSNTAFAYSLQYTSTVCFDWLSFSVQMILVEGSSDWLPRTVHSGDGQVRLPKNLGTHAHSRAYETNMYDSHNVLLSTNTSKRYKLKTVFFIYKYIFYQSLRCIL